MAAEFGSAQPLLRFISQQQAGKLRLAVVCGTLASACLIGQWYLLCWLLYQNLLAAPGFALPLPVLAGILAVIALRLLLLRAQELLASNASVAGRQALRQALLQSWQRRPVDQLQLQSPAALASQWLEDVEAFDGYLARYWPQQYLTLLSPLLILLAVCSVDWLAGLLLLISAPLIPLFMVLVGLGAEQLNQRHFVLRQRLAGHFLDRIRQLATIQRLQAVQASQLEVASRSDQYRRVLMRTLKVAFLSSAVLEFFSSVAIASVALYIGFGLLGAISWGPAAGLTLFSGLFILILAPEFFQPLRSFAQFYHDRASALAAANQLAPLLCPADFQAGQPASPVAPLQASAPPARQHLLINQLAVGYPAAGCLQANLNASLHTGQCLLISGESGLGKTTILQTLAGLLPPFSLNTPPGSMLLNQQPLAEHAIAYLPQQPWLINGSWADNLKLLAPTATEPQMLQVLQQLGLAELVLETQAGLYRQISELGQGLSGGQLQRLALARVLLAPTAVVLLDEPTASLDQQSRDLVLSALQQLKPQVMLILVSHDPALLTLADQHWQLAPPGQQVTQPTGQVVYEN
ncbi:ABC transporter ATP-binding protein [Arsukibacterium ikkense]|uniref:ABC transporter ATP-binding protein n=1 Tax=Arsukibacterium ikkense TaxID=336831 RepID=A0A0M2V3J1_9GAMM|nr:thiol reductant ABC exporter subunit CydD [Arsukibacterium ikkense]KKO44979.1 ABC transporter ATP-binding protein [Arsukibacterium ikkense]